MVHFCKHILIKLYNISRSITYNCHTSLNEARPMAYSETQKRAAAQYNKKAHDRIDLVVPKEKRQKIKYLATRKGMNTNSFINAAIDKAMAKQSE